VDGLADGDTRVFGCVMKIDVQVALRAHLQVDQAVARKDFQHVIEKTDPSFNVICAGSVEIYRDLYIGFGGLSGNFCFSHERLPNL
jgi:hypothetical protein